MVKHNNVVPNAHFHKHWQTRVRVMLDQAMRKKRRSIARKEKAQKIAPRPAGGLLRPAVRCQTQRYNMKIRGGRGFTLEELKEAGISADQAQTIGISLDPRRRNKSVESLQLNVQRLKAYKARLVVFPRKAGTKSIKKGDATKTEAGSVTQITDRNVLPLTQIAKPQEYMAITDELKKKLAVRTLKQAKATQALVGKKRWAKEKEEGADKAAASGAQDGGDDE